LSKRENGMADRWPADAAGLRAVWAADEARVLLRAGGAGGTDGGC
jgi:hypothetical protein